MPTRQAFGRRTSPQAHTLAAPSRVEPSVAALFGGAPVESAAQTEPLPVDQELEDWKRARKQNFRVPWSQLLLMASLCFGIASFVLPDSVNDGVQWLLYALTAVSAWLAYTKRRRQPTPDATGGR